ncbi:MAG TPA: transposase [Thermoanaerobaculia bacterium]|nr:transposase [Thermoanaerobaculia bacterium]
MQFFTSELSGLFAAFSPLFTEPTVHHALRLVEGAILTVGRRTVASALRSLGLQDDPHFQNYHRVLSRARWSCRRAAKILLLRLVDTFAPDGPLVFGLDDTIERRWGEKIQERGVYRDPLRSSRTHFVKASGLRWASLMLLTRIPWAQRIWALPVLTVLAPSERFSQRNRRRHKTVVDWARQMILQIRRWLPEREMIAVSDAAYAGQALFDRLRRANVTVVSQIRLDSALYAPPPLRKQGQRGRPRKVGERLPKLRDLLDDPTTSWQRTRISFWYGGSDAELEFTTGTAVWYSRGVPAVSIRWVLVRDPSGKLEPKAFASTDVEMDPLEILRHYVSRWSVEVTFEESRRHLGVESQRQWSSLAIARTTPCLFGLFSMVALLADRLHQKGLLKVRQAAWYEKTLPTFSDALASVRRHLWACAYLSNSPFRDDHDKIPDRLFERLTDALAYAA